MKRCLHKSKSNCLEESIYLIKSMNELEGWKGNNELMKLITKYGVQNYRR